MSTQQSLPAKT